MNNPLQSILASIHHFLTQHPELAPQVEFMAGQVQGKAVDELQSFAEWRKYRGLSTSEMFAKIYAEGEWGSDPAAPFYSGSGSHEPQIVEAYVRAVSGFLTEAPTKLSALDLGCGDFNVGSRLRPYCSTYIACDVVPSLIEFNRQKFADQDVDFRVLDLAEDDLPAAEVVFVRQVLQHLSNDQIARFTAKIARACRYLILTEHLPSAPFKPNIDKAPGSGIRLGYLSGVVLTEPPFNLRPSSSKLLCDAPEGDGVIRTTLYSFG